MTAVDSSTSELIATFQPLAKRLAHRYSGGSGLDPDVEQVAMLGLTLAASRFDASRGPFAPFAVATISGEIKKHFRRTGWGVRVPRRIQEATLAVSSVTEVLEQELDRSPTPDEVAARAGLSVEQVLDALHARAARTPSAMDVEPAGSDGELDLLLDLSDAVAHLPDSDRHLVRLRYVEELTQRRIGAILGLSQTQVHREIKRVTTDLRHLMSADIDEST